MMQLSTLSANLCTCFDVYTILLHFVHAGADKSRGGGAISVRFGSQVSQPFGSAREMKHTSQHCFDKTMDDKMALYRKCCLPNCRKSRVNKATFAGFTGLIAPIAPWIRPCVHVWAVQWREVGSNGVTSFLMRSLIFLQLWTALT